MQWLDQFEQRSNSLRHPQKKKRNTPGNPNYPVKQETWVKRRNIGDQKGDHHFKCNDYKSILRSKSTKYKVNRWPKGAYLFVGLEGKQVLEVVGGSAGPVYVVHRLG